MTRLLTCLAICLGLGLAGCTTVAGGGGLAHLDVSPEDAFPVVLWEHRQGRRLYFLLRPFSYCDPDTGQVIVVPAGFETDFASVPPRFQRVFRPDGSYAQAAIIHDWLYAIGLPGHRQEADRIFLRAMQEYGVDWPTRRAVYRAVRMGGETGYGLADDWRFRDPQTRAVIPTAPKPQRIATQTLPNCAGYRDGVISGRIFAPLIRPGVTGPG